MIAGLVVEEAVGRYGAASACFSDDRRYRYLLTRVWDPSKPLLNFCMLNPSSADHEVLDPTVRRCVGFVEREGCGGLIVTNLFAFRATKPVDMTAAAEDPVGPRNDEAIRLALRQSDATVCAWGTHGGYLGRDQAMLAMLVAHRLPVERLRRLGPVNKGGTPKHPLYVRGDAEMVAHP